MKILHGNAKQAETRQHMQEIQVSLADVIYFLNNIEELSGYDIYVDDEASEGKVYVTINHSTFLFTENE